MSAFEDNRPPRLAWGMYKRFALGAIVIVLCTAGAVSTAALLEVKGAADIFAKFSAPIAGIQEKGVLDNVDPGGPQTLLLLGSDRRYIDIKNHTPVRSDTIMLLRLDPSKGATTVMSIPRDLKVPIPGFGTDKINAAYALGGPKLAVKTIRALLGVPINHVVNVNFGGFRRAVNRLGCVFADVDRRYFNDNNPPAGGGPDYAVINVKAGYQKLCGQNALDYVRYRHFDSDPVRSARQQDFLRQAKDQVGVSKLFGDRTELLKIFARYTQTDIRGETAILRLLKLAFESAKNPIQEIHFEAEPEGNYLVIAPQKLQRDVESFMNAKGSSGARGKARRTTSDKRLERKQARKRRDASVPPGLFLNKTAGEDQGVALGTKVPFPVYYAKFSVLGSQYRPNDARAYDIYDRSHHRYRAYRIVASAPGIGQYYGVQGMTWKGPPILDNPSEKRKMNGRTYELFFDGNRLRLVAWRTPRAVYWVSNTLLQSLTNRQMLGLARSLTRVGA
jgi:LCP family protein required for cell wall assembly